MGLKNASRFLSLMLLVGMGAVLVGIACCSGPVALNGLALAGDPYTQANGTSKRLGYLADGEAIAFEPGDVFSFAPVQLQHGVIVKNLRCVMKDDTPKGYIQANLIRGPINTVDPVVGSSQVIASVVTLPVDASADFVERTSRADPSRAKIDNTKYGYFLRVDFLDNPGISGSGTTLSLRGCVIEY